MVATSKDTVGMGAHQHSTHIRSMLEEVRDHARLDVNEVQDERAKALFETTAEVLQGLIQAHGDYEQGKEPAWN